MAAAVYDIRALRASLVALIEKAKGEVIANHERAGQVASGKTRDSLQVASEDSQNGIEVSLWGRQFFQGVETGRRGGNVPRGFYYIIRQWAIDKGLQFATDRERNSFAYLVSRKIAREGTSLYRSGGRDDIYSNVFKQLIDDIDQELGVFLDGMADTMFDEAMASIQIH